MRRLITVREIFMKSGYVDSGIAVEEFESSHE